MAIEKVRPEMDLNIGRDFDRFSNMLDRFFDDTLKSAAWTRQFTPQVDVSETETHYHYEISLPGMKKEDININVDDYLLTISGERKFEDEKKKEGQYHLVENRYGSFERTLTLPRNAKLDSVDAKYENGILMVSVEKDKQGPGRQIEIK